MTGYTITGTEGARIKRQRSQGKIREMPIRRPQSDPPTRRDGSCVVCGAPRRSPAGLTHDDPFCRTECCKAWYAA